MDYSHGRASTNIQERGTWDIAQQNIQNILRVLKDPNSENFRTFKRGTPRATPRVPIPYDPNNGIALGPSDNIESVPAAASQFVDPQNDLTAITPNLAGGGLPQSVQRSRDVSRMLEQFMPETPAQVAPNRLQMFQKQFQNIDPNNLELLKVLGR